MNNERFFLLKVLGLSAIPRIFSFVFTLFSLPFMLLRLGANEYGIVVYIGSVTAIFESFADFGVSSAAGKEIASTRAMHPQNLKSEIVSWSIFQGIASILGAIPMYIAVFYLVNFGRDTKVDFSLIAMTVSASLITIISNFVRAILTSLMQFKSLAIVDSVESITRSVSYVVTGLLFPTAMGLVSLTLGVSIVVSITGAVILLNSFRSLKPSDNLADAPNDRMMFGISKAKLRESLKFMWLRLITRSFTGLPLFIIGRLFGSGIVGVIGGFQKMVDLITFPFSVIGNALSVRVKEIVSLDLQQVNAFWNLLFRVLSLSVFIWCVVYLAAPIFIVFFFKSSPPSDSIFFILSLTVISASISYLIAPISDYLGALKKRNQLMTIFTILQFPFIWFGGKYFGEFFSISAYVLILIIVNLGYIIIAKKVFYGRQSFSVPLPVRNFLLICLFAFVSATIVSNLVMHFPVLSIDFDKTFPITLFLFSFIVLAGMFLSRKIRYAYLNFRLLELH